MFNDIRVSRLIATAATAVLSLAFVSGVSTPLKAESFSIHKAVVTFASPVEVPGRVLPAGNYMFKSLDNNELVQVFSADEKQLFATISVVQQDRPAQVDSDCFVQLIRTRADAPQEVEGFYLPGRSTGFQFIYPVTHAATHHN